MGSCFALHHRSRLLALLARCTFATGTLAPDNLRVRHSHHLFRNPICFLLKCVPGNVNLQFCSDFYRRIPMYRYLAEVVGEAG